MQIRRFAVSDFRKLGRRVEIAGLADGLNVIVGDNEEGKSTLLKALQAAFFDRHKLTGKALADMMPFGSSGLRPAVEVEFETGGTAWRLNKTFGRNPAAALEGGGQRLAGDAAEELLCGLLGFSRPGHGPAREAHRGLAGLLWVEQGRAFAALGMNADSQAMLREAIEGEVGQVLGGERGRILLAEVAKRTAEYFTPKGQARKALKEPRDKVEMLQGECAALEAELRSYDGKVGRLAGLQERLARHERDRTLEKARTALEAVEAAGRQVKEVGGKVEAAAAQLDAAQSAAAAATGERDRRRKLATEAAAAAKAAQAAGDALEALQPEFRAAERQLKAAVQQRDAANRQRTAAQAGWQQARQALRWAETAAEVEKATARLADAEKLNEQLGIVQRALAANPADDKAVRGLRRLESDCVRLRAALDAAAAVLLFEPAAGGAVTRDGAPVAAGTPVRVTEQTSFALDGFGALTVTPGGQDIAQLRADLAAAQQRLAAQLAELGLKDLAAAEIALREKGGLTARAGTLKGELKGVAPEGLDGLRASVRHSRETLAGLAGEGAPPEIDAARAAERTAELAHDVAARAAEDAENRHRTALAGHERLQKQRIGADAEARQKTGAAERLQEALKAERGSASDEALEQRVLETGRGLGARQAAHEAVQAELAALDAEGVELERQRAADAHRLLAATIDADRQKARDLTVELRTLGQRGLAEELDRRRGELEIAQAELARVEADAKAWKLLHETLHAAEAEAKEVFVAPVRERLAPYLSLVFPQTELRLSEDDLEIDALVRDGQPEPFASLSVGAREQVAVLTRLALADLLRAKDRPVALILDDPLVNTDDARFDRMVLALRMAAKQVQIVALTCHEARYEALGARTVRLADCRADV